MKINKLETHDRLQHLIKDQSETIAKGAEECLKRNPLSLAMQDRSPYVYLFAHPRTTDDGINKRILWQPRLTKPTAQTNSYLFRATSKTDLIEVCWLLPPRELWEEYKKGNVTESGSVLWSIQQFQSNRDKLETKDPKDLEDWVIENIYRQIKEDMKIKSKLGSLVVY